MSYERVLSRIPQITLSSFTGGMKRFLGDNHLNSFFGMIPMSKDNSTTRQEQEVERRLSDAAIVARYNR